MVEVPGVGCQTPVDGVNDGVLDDVYTPRHAGREEGLRPARQPIGLHQEASRKKPVVRSHLPVHDVLSENMCADGYTNTQSRVSQMVTRSRSQISVCGSIQFCYKPCSIPKLAYFLKMC